MTSAQQNEKAFIVGLWGVRYQSSLIDTESVPAAHLQTFAPTGPLQPVVRV